MEFLLVFGSNLLFVAIWGVEFGVARFAKKPQMLRPRIWPALDHLFFFRCGHEMPFVVNVSYTWVKTGSTAILHSSSSHSGT
jgi:hypothetical protein